MTGDGEMSVLIRLVFLLVLACTISCRDHNAQQSVKKQISRIENEIGLTFPANSRLDQFFEREVFVDPVWMAKVFIPASSYEGFKKALITKPDDNATVQGALADSTSWWKPSNIVFKKQYLQGSQTLVNVIVSKEGEEFALYIECAVF
jgi:hypothetical protein